MLKTALCIKSELVKRMGAEPASMADLAVVMLNLGGIKKSGNVKSASTPHGPF